MIKIVRLDYGEKQTLGYLFNGLKQIACTLELPYLDNQSQISCIPKGVYEVVKRTSAKYGEHFHILNVPNREYILIHNGNYYTQIKGCVLVGYTHSDIDKDGLKDVTSSVKKLNELIKTLPNKFTLEII